MRSRSFALFAAALFVVLLCFFALRPSTATATSSSSDNDCVCVCARDADRLQCAQSADRVVWVDASSGCASGGGTSNECCSMLRPECRLAFGEFVACKFGSRDADLHDQIDAAASRFLLANDESAAAALVEQRSDLFGAHPNAATAQWTAVLRGSVAFYLNMHYDAPVPFAEPLRADQLAELLAQAPPTFESAGAALVSEYLAFAAPPAGGRRPRVTFVGGGGGAGKSSSLEHWVASGLLPAARSVPGVVYINHDELIERHALFPLLVERGSYAGADLLHAASQRLGEQIYAAALRAGSDVVYEGTMASLVLTQQKIALAQQHGFETRMLGLTVDAGIAIRRCLLRALSTKRYVPPRVLKAHHRDFSRNWPAYCNAVDACFLFQSSRTRVPQLVAQSERGPAQLVVHLPLAYDAFAAKRFINVDAANVFELYSRPATSGDDVPPLPLWNFARPAAAASWSDVVASLQLDAERALAGDGRCAPTTQAVPAFLRLKSIVESHVHEQPVCFCARD